MTAETIMNLKNAEDFVSQTEKEEKQRRGDYENTCFPQMPRNPFEKIADITEDNEKMELLSNVADKLVDGIAEKMNMSLNEVLDDVIIFLEEESPMYYGLTEEESDLIYDFIDTLTDNKVNLRGYYYDETFDLHGTAEDLIHKDLRYAKSVEEMERIAHFVKKDIDTARDKATVTNDDLTYVSLQIEKAKEKAVTGRDDNLADIKELVFEAKRKDLIRSEAIFHFDKSDIYVFYEKDNNIKLVYDENDYENNQNYRCSVSLSYDRLMNMDNDEFQSVLGELYYYSEREDIDEDRTENDDR